MTPGKITEEQRRRAVQTLIRFVEIDKRNKEKIKQREDEERQRLYSSTQSARGHV